MEADLKKSNFLWKTVKLDDDDIRLDRWFKRNCKGVSFNLIAKNTRKGLIRVNGKRVDVSDKIKKDDVISYPKFSPPPVTLGGFPAKQGRDSEILLNYVIYKNDDIIVLNKPAGLAVQGGWGIKESVDSLSEALQFDFPEKPKLVHRLDKETSGILILARRTSVAAKLSQMFRDKEFKKTYVAIVSGVPKNESGKIDIPIEKVNKDKFEKVERSHKGKQAITYYKLMDRAADKYSLVELQLITGRTHQLRAHLALIGCPIVGDGKYGKRTSFGDLMKKNLYLHAYKIEFALNGRNYNIVAPLPGYFRNAVDNLGLSVSFKQDL